MTDYFVHPQGICESETVGTGTRIWAFSHVLPRAKIGADCNICDGVFIENDVIVGDRVTIKGGVQVWDGVRIGNDVFVGPNATFTNDPFPRSKKYLVEYPVTVVDDGASLGANCTLLPGIHVGQGSLVGAGAVVTHNVPPNAIVVGNPARIIGYADTARVEVDGAIGDRSGEVVVTNEVRGVTLHRLPLVGDMRGDLSVAEFARDIPFDVARYFIVFNVPSSDVRGEHAHRACHQFLVCVKGSCAAVVDDGKHRSEISLNAPNLGLYIPPMVWGIQYKYSPDAVLLVFASHPYDADDYIRDYDLFVNDARAV